MSERVFKINGKSVAAETFASICADLFAAGWTLTPPEHHDPGPANPTPPATRGHNEPRGAASRRSK